MQYHKWGGDLMNPDGKGEELVMMEEVIAEEEATETVEAELAVALEEPEVEEQAQEDSEESSESADTDTEV